MDQYEWLFVYPTSERVCAQGSLALTACVLYAEVLDLGHYQIDFAPESGTMLSEAESINEIERYK